MKKKILIRGPVLSQSGYGEQSRFALRALKSREDLFDIFIELFDKCIDLFDIFIGLVDIFIYRFDICIDIFDIFIYIFNNLKHI